MSDKDSKDRLNEQSDNPSDSQKDLRRFLIILLIAVIIAIALVELLCSVFSLEDVACVFCTLAALANICVLVSRLIDRQKIGIVKGSIFCALMLLIIIVSFTLKLSYDFDIFFNIVSIATATIAMIGDLITLFSENNK